MNPGAERDQSGLGWTPSQRRGLIVLLIVLLAFLTYQSFRHRLYVSDPQPYEGARAPELQSRIDPNSADWQTLAAIPGLGEKRARAIVAYRDAVHKADLHKFAFEKPTDLLNIRGIGAATVQNLRPCLVFPSDRPETQF